MPALAPGEVEARKSAFLAALSTTGTVTAACVKLGFDDARVYEWLREDHPAYDPAFVRAFAQAKERTADRIEQSLIDRATTGNTAWDTTAAIFLLKGYRPMFRDQLQVNQRIESVSVSLDISDLAPADKAALLQRLASKALNQAPPELPPGDDHR